MIVYGIWLLLFTNAILPQVYAIRIPVNDASEKVHPFHLFVKDTSGKVETAHALSNNLLTKIRAWLTVEDKPNKQENVPYKKPNELCDDSLKLDTTDDDVQFVYDRFTKRFTGTLSYLGEYPSGLTSCQMDPLTPLQRLEGWYPVAVGPNDYTHSLFCGSCLKISPRYGEKKRGLQTKPRFEKYGFVVDMCHHCKQGDIHMYKDDEDAMHDIIYEAVDCPSIRGERGFIRMKVSKCSDKRMRIQLKNTKLPTTALEVFQDENWKCLPRTTDNFFLLNITRGIVGANFILPMQARATTVSGETLGFTIDGHDHTQDIVVPVQYRAFEDRTDRSVKAPRMKCYKRGTISQHDEIKDNITIENLHQLPNNKHLWKPDNHIIINATNYSTTTQLNINSSLKNLTNVDHAIMIPSNNSILKHINPLDNNTDKSTSIMETVKKIQVLPSFNSINNTNNGDFKNLTLQNLSKNINSTFENIVKLYKAAYKPDETNDQKLNLVRVSSNLCAFRSDGHYEFPEDCASFLICKDRNSFVKRCPNGLLFNQEESVCDWPNNVHCEGALEKAGERTPNPIVDEEIYTKKFLRLSKKLQSLIGSKRSGSINANG